MNKQEKLKAIIDETDKLISKRVTSSSPEFQAWKTKAERFLINEYGKDSYEVEAFQKMHFSLSIITSSTPQSDFVDACKRGLERAKAVLLTYLEEINDNNLKENTMDWKSVPIQAM